MTPSNIDIYNHFVQSCGLPIRVSALAAREHLHQQLVNSAPNRLNRYGKKVFSQNDEDGLTLEFCKRVFPRPGMFLEFGIGNGLENNTLILLANRWGGGWVGNEELAFPLPEANSPRLGYQAGWVTLENCLDLATKSLPRNARMSDIDILSIDLDGNDIHILRKLCSSGVRPSLIIVEYNAKFPPPIQFEIEYDNSHTWNKDDYMGASLTSFEISLRSFGYKLICCNLTGSNAYFVRDDHFHLFPEAPRNIEDIYREPLYELSFMFSRGHPTSVKTVARLLSE